MSHPLKFTVRRPGIPAQPATVWVSCSSTVSPFLILWLSWPIQCWDVWVVQWIIPVFSTQVMKKKINYNKEMEDRSNIILTTNKSWMENMAWVDISISKVNLHSVDPRISSTCFSSQKQHRMRHNSSGRMPTHVRVEHGPFFFARGVLLPKRRKEL